MFQKFKITFYSLIVLLVLVLPSQADAVEFYADSCKGWDCDVEGQICPQGAEGASGGNYICKNKRWMAMLAESCKGWDCSHEGQLCPNGAEGANGSDFICTNSKWVKVRGQSGSTKCGDFRDNGVWGIDIPQALYMSERCFQNCSTQKVNEGGFLVQLSPERCLAKCEAQFYVEDQCK